jgi:hypothetical protein
MWTNLICGLSSWQFAQHDPAGVKVFLASHPSDFRKGQRLEAFAADPIGSLPQDDQRAPSSLVIKRSALTCLPGLRRRLMIQNTIADFS